MSHTASTPQIPTWLTRASIQITTEKPAWFTQFTPPPQPQRRASVLMLFGPAPHTTGEPHDPANIEIGAHSMRSHAAQVAFPGGHEESTDNGPIATALREAHEEVGIQPASVEIISTLPALFMRPRRNCVTPVIGWWHTPHHLEARDPREVARVERIAIADLVNPANRFSVISPSGHRGPGFTAQGLFIWGFTAMLLDAMITAAGLTLPYDHSIVRPLPEAQLAARRRATPPEK